MTCGDVCHVCVGVKFTETWGTTAQLTLTGYQPQTNEKKLINRTDRQS
jgi:hypothetical protein